MSFPQLVQGGEIEELADDLLRVAAYFQVSTHFSEDELFRAQNQFKIMVRGARERERRDTQNLPEGRTFAVDSVWNFWRDLPGWPKNQTFKRLLKHLLIAPGQFRYDFDFDEGEGERLLILRGCRLCTVCVAILEYTGLSTSTSSQLQR